MNVEFSYPLFYAFCKKCVLRGRARSLQAGSKGWRTVVSLIKEDQQERKERSGKTKYVRSIGRWWFTCILCWNSICSSCLETQWTLISDLIKSQGKHFQKPGEDSESVAPLWISETLTRSKSFLFRIKNQTSPYWWKSNTSLCKQADG